MPQDASTTEAFARALAARRFGAEYDSRLNFLYKVVEDTQNTIRFIDTKAVFCATILTAMVAGSLQVQGTHTHWHRLIFILFIVSAVLALTVCTRVVFPTIKPSASIFGSAETAGPKFYVGHNKAHHWIRHTLRNQVGEVLEENHDSYLASVEKADDHALLNSMCDEVLVVALIRQVKSDRLHAAMFCLGATVLLFAAVMIF
jgi:hypothetical protein